MKNDPFISRGVNIAARGRTLRSSLERTRIAAKREVLRTVDWLAGCMGGGREPAREIAIRAEKFV